MSARTTFALSFSDPQGYQPRKSNDLYLTGQDPTMTNALPVRLPARLDFENKTVSRLVHAHSHQSTSSLAEQHCTTCSASTWTRTLSSAEVAPLLVAPVLVKIARPFRTLISSSARKEAALSVSQLSPSHINWRVLTLLLY